MPEYLYHYTTVDILEKILENRTIRFRGLDKMDDLQEPQSSDLKYAGRFCLISSWCEACYEIIPMWLMYSKPKEKGIRIKMKANPFIFYDNKSDGIPFLLPTLVPIKYLYENHIQLINFTKAPDLVKIDYTNEKSLLFPNVQINSDQLGLNMLGLHKNRGWEFQKEWRYRIIIIPFMWPPFDLDNAIDIKSFFEKRDSFLKKADDKLYNVKDGISADNYSLPIDFCDLHISRDAILGLEVMTSPFIDEKNKEKVYHLKEKYHFSKIVESDLTGTISQE